jgi:hypothetical protein
MSIDTMAPEPVENAGTNFSDGEYYRQFKTLSTAAVASAAFGALSIFAFCDWLLLLTPALGAALGIVALGKIRARPNELAGTGLARAGIGLSALFALSAVGYLSYQAVNRVPAWATEISYEQLQPDPDWRNQIFPPEAQSLDGKKLYIEGYIYPARKDMNNIGEFILCRDRGACCFGGNPKLTDRIQVRLTGGKTINFSQKLFAVAGEFHLRPSQANGLEGGVIYHLDAEFVR